MESEVIQKKSGDVIVICECGNIHTLHYNDETEDIEIKTKYQKKQEAKKDDTKAKNDDTKREQRKSVFY